MDYGLQTFRVLAVLHKSVSFQLFLFFAAQNFSQHVSFFISIQCAWCFIEIFKLNLVPVNFDENCNLNRECKICTKIKHVLITRFFTRSPGYMMFIIAPLVGF